MITLTDNQEGALFKLIAQSLETGDRTLRFRGSRKDPSGYWPVGSTLLSQLSKLGLIDVWTIRVSGWDSGTVDYPNSVGFKYRTTFNDPDATDHVRVRLTDEAFEWIKSRWHLV